LSRELSLSGKNNCRLNGRMTTASLIKNIAEYIIDIHGQHDNQSLLRKESHIELLDLFAGERIQNVKKEYLELLQKQKDIKKNLLKYSGNMEQRQKKAELLKFQVDEIKKANLKQNEEEELNEQRMLLVNSEKLLDVLAESYEILYSGYEREQSSFEGINKAITEFKDIQDIGSKFKDILKRLEDVSIQLQDVSEDIRNERDNLEFDPKMLEQVEERIDFIYGLERKYGNSIKEILEYSENASRELESLEKSEETVAMLMKELTGINNKLYEKACEINEERCKASELLEKEIGQQLNDLEMKKARFKVNINFNNEIDKNGERKFTNNGLDRVEFLISPNIGEPLKSLSKIVSGGEMSRIMLAIKNILAGVDEIPVLIFDEIDSGISGKVSQRIGEKLCNISTNHQVICVTHLAQIACMADRHFQIDKTSDSRKTTTKVSRLNSEQTKNEIARILGGTRITEITLKHAEEMIHEALNYKNALHT